MCKANGVEYVELKVAIDGISVMTSPSNNAVTCLTLRRPVRAGRPGVHRLRQVERRPARSPRSSAPTRPSRMPPLTITGPGEESGTYDSFVELAIDPEAKTRDKSTRRPSTRSRAGLHGHRRTTTRSSRASPDNDTSLGWVGFAFLEENLDKVKAIAGREGGERDCVAPTAETIADGDYPLSRDLYIYVNKAKAASNPAVGAWVDYYLADGTIVTVLQTVPYIALSPTS